ncbi:MAG TPA: hypothetical protein VM344_04915 [Vitreimonas sp.]|nr:hypothetical protein [Vitreimonas sp.]
MTRTRIRRRPALLVGGLVALLAIAVPVIAADPFPSGPPGHANAEQRGKPDKGPAIERTITGTIEQGSDDKGRPTFTLTDGGTTWELSAGPKWFHGDGSPLAAWVGQSVEIAGTYHEGETELDVDTVNGERLRHAGKPAWAGGPWDVGEAHPGWREWMVDGKPGHGYGREHAPGQLKDKHGTDADD